MPFRLGKISDLASPLTVFIFFLQFFLVIGYFGYSYYMDSSKGCIDCHGSKEKIEEFGYPQFYFTLEDVRKQTGHKTVFCRDCHLGNGRTSDKDKAHREMLRPIFVSEDAEPVDRIRVYPKEEKAMNKIEPSGEDKLFELLPKVKDNGELILHPKVRNILWHDRDPITFNFDPKIAEKPVEKEVATVRSSNNLEIRLWELILDREPCGHGLNPMVPITAVLPLPIYLLWKC